MEHKEITREKIKPENWIDYLDVIQDDRDARNILNLFMRKNDKHTIINYS